MRSVCLEAGLKLDEEEKERIRMQANRIVSFHSNNRCEHSVRWLATSSHVPDYKFFWHFVLWTFLFRPPNLYSTSENVSKSEMRTEFSIWSKLNDISFNRHKIIQTVFRIFIRNTVNCLLSIYHLQIEYIFYSFCCMLKTCHLKCSFEDARMACS